MVPEHIIEGCKKQDRMSQRRLFDLLHPEMLGVCLRYAANRDEAQDILQDGFIKVFRSMHTYRGKGAFSGWVRKIMVNTALEYYRKRKPEVSSDLTDSEALMMVAEENILDGIQTKELLKMIHEMPTGYRLVFNLFAIEGYGHKEIAKRLGISVATSHSQYHRARAYLKKVLAAEKKDSTKSIAG